MESITLNVSPDVLTAKAGELTNEKTTVNDLLEEAKTEINSLTGVWISKAATEFQKRFKQIYGDIDNILAIISEYISNLTEAANIYSTAESAAGSVVEGLPTSGVFQV